MSKNHSFFLDMYILIQTVEVVLFQKRIALAGRLCGSFGHKKTKLMLGFFMAESLSNFLDRVRDVLRVDIVFLEHAVQSWASNPK
jgi:hypothetical protein